MNKPKQHIIIYVDSLESKVCKMVGNDLKDMINNLPKLTVTYARSLWFPFTLQTMLCQMKWQSKRRVIIQDYIFFLN